MKTKCEPTVLDPLNGQEHLARAITIAVLGNFSIGLLSGDPIEELNRITPADMIQLLREKGISFRGLSIVEIDRAHTSSTETDMVVSLCNPTLDRLVRSTNPYSAAETMMAGIQALQEKVIEFNLPFTGAAYQMLRIGYEKLRLAVKDTFTAVRIASVIACIDSCEQIESHHIAEAINYISFKYEP